MSKARFVMSLAGAAAFLFLFQSICLAATMPVLKNADCAKWVAFEDDTVYALNYYYREKGISLMKADEENALRKSAYEQKLAYVQGLLDAYSLAYEVTGNEKLKFSFKFDDYVAGIDENCADKSNKDQKIVGTISQVNEKLKMK
jgi:hypothetical protein